MGVFQCEDGRERERERDGGRKRARMREREREREEEREKRVQTFEPPAFSRENKIRTS